MKVISAKADTVYLKCKQCGKVVPMDLETYEKMAEGKFGPNQPSEENS
jgi:uncharacterized Zn finger protein